MSTILEVKEISGLTNPTYNSGAANKKYIDEGFIPSGIVLNAISSQHISGGTITTGDLSLNTNTISGLIDPTYPSAATNKHYVDSLVMNISGSFYPSSLGKGVSGATLPLTDWYTASSQKLSDISGSIAPARVWYIESSQKLSDISGNIIGNYYPSTLGKQVSGAVLANTLHSANSALHSFSVDDYMTSANIIANYIKSSQALENFYPSALGKGVSGAVLPLTDWYTESSQKLSDISGNLIGKYFPSTLGASINTWYTESSQKLSDISGNIIGKYYPSDLGKLVSGSVLPLTDWYLNSSQKYSGWYYSSQFWASSQDWYNASSQKLSDWYSSGGKLGSAYTSGISIREMATQQAVLTSLASGETLIYKQNNARWENELPPMNFNVANIRLSANQNINMTQFDCPTNEKAYLWQASACGSGGIAISGMFVQMLAGSTLPLNGSNSIYKTSCQIVQHGYPLGVSAAGDHVELRFMYSGTGTGLEGTQYRFGSAFAQIGVY